MCSNERILPRLNAVIYYSNTGESRRIARYVADSLGYELLDMPALTRFEFGNLVIVFPVHCQSIPKPIKPVLAKLTADNVILLATYGKMSHGNVLQECQKKYKWHIVAGAYIPTKHSYLIADTPFSQYEKLGFLGDAFREAREVTIPKSFKNPLADLFPGTRSRIGVRIIRGKGCIHCGKCESACNNEKCLRCLKCVSLCPVNALSFKLNIFMKLYLKKKPQDKLVIYR